MSKLVTPFRVGLLVLVAAVLFGATFSYVHKGGLTSKDAITVWAYFHDASGLGPRSKVQIAGIGVGEITTVTLEGQKARISMLIKRDVPLKVDAIISKRSESLLGDYLLDLVPGSEEATMILEGGQITHVNDSTGMDQIFGSLTKITGDISQVTESLRKSLGGEQGTESLEKIVANLSQMSDQLNNTIRSSGQNLNDILANFKDVSEDVKGITGADENKIIVANVEHITEDVRDVLATIKKILGSGEGNMQDTVANLKETLEKLNKSLDNLSQITDKVNKGEGTVGQLINDKRLGQALTDTVVDASDYVSRLVNLQTEVTLRSEWLFSQQQDKIYLQLRLISRPDKYYTLEVIDDPSGTVSQQVVQNNPPSPLQVAEQVETVTTQALKFSAQFNKRYYFATFRFGIIESTGGVGADLHFLDDALTVKMDAFDFTDPNRLYPRLKAYANYAFLGHIFLTAGMDDILNDQVRDPLTRRLIVGRQLLAGGGIFFTDDDLKAVISAAPKL